MSEEKKNELESTEAPENQPAENLEVSDKKVGDSVEETKEEPSAEIEQKEPATVDEVKVSSEPETEEQKSNEEVVAEESVTDETESEVETEKTEEGSETGETEEESQEPGEAEEYVREDVPHDDFDWELGNNYELPYSEKEIESLIETYENTLTALEESDVVKGRVKAIHDGDVILDLNYKSDGLVSLSEFRDTPDLQPGDEVDVYVEQKEDDRGQLVLSRRKAKLLKAWESIVDSYENGTVIRGKVVSKTKGGLIADCSGLETFLPGSQIDIKPIIDYDSYVGKTMDFKVVKINEMIKNAVVSHKALIESDLAEQRDQIISGLEKGQVLEGIVKNLTDFGAFMDLGGVDGLLYITDISWGRINHPSEILNLNDKLNVVVLDFDENKKRISLGLKQLQPHPWDIVGENIKEGSVVKGKIVNIEDYGAFLEIKPGVEGLIHVSEVSWSNQPVNAREFFKLHEEREAMVVSIDNEERKMSLSIKQLSQDPWTEIDTKYPVGSRHSGEVKNLTPYGVFVELEDGIGGMVHISDLSWTKRFSHPSEFTRVGENIEIVILEIDKQGRKLSLGHKQIEENPWDTFQTVFPVGSYHEATIIRKDDRGAIVQLPYGLEAFAPIKHIRKEDGTMAEVEEILTVKVIEFNADDKRIMVSHLRYLEDIQKEAKDEIRKEKAKEQEGTRKAVKQTQSKVERTTLGELDVLSQLKEQLEGEIQQETDASAESEAIQEKEKAESDASAEAEIKQAKKQKDAETIAEPDSKKEKSQPGTVASAESEEGNQEDQESEDASSNPSSDSEATDEQNEEDTAETSDDQSEDAGTDDSSDEKEEK